MTEGPTDNHSRDLVPRPDPTTLTTAQLQREISSAREFGAAALEGVKAVIDTKIAGVEKAVGLLQSTVDKLPEQAGVAVHHLQVLQDERFNGFAAEMKAHFIGISARFDERDTRFDQLDAAGKLALSAALQAQKDEARASNEAIRSAQAEMKAALTKQIDQVASFLAQVEKSTGEKIDDVKSRLDRGEGRTKGLGDGWGYIGLAIGAIVGVVAVVFALIDHAK